MQLQLEFQIYHLVTGLIGGLIRGLVGIMKQTQKPEEFKIHWKYFGLTMLVSGARFRYRWCGFWTDC